MPDTAPTAENLAKILDAEGLPALAARARANEFHDYRSPHTFPEHVLAAELRDAGREDLRQRVIAGEFDASREESQAWAASPEGQDTMRELLPANALDVPADGRLHGLAPDPRDQDGPQRDHKTAIGKHGHTFDGLTLHVVGLTTREELTTGVHNMIRQMPRGEGVELCGVEHMEDIGIWQTPHTGRDALRREVVRLRQFHRREVVIIHGYQHVGPCPTEGATRG